MPIKVTSTKIVDPTQLKIKVAVFGEAGIGKTKLCGTAPRPIIISAERGTLSLGKEDIPLIEVNNKEEVDEAYQYLLTPEAQELYDTVCLDSVSEIAEVLLSELKSKYTDGRQFYGILADDISSMIRAFRDDLPYHVVFTVKQTRFTDDYTGITKFLPDMPGNNLKNGIPYFFDELFAMRVADKPDGSGTFRFIQAQPDMTFQAKDRSGALGLTGNMEPPNLTTIFSKIIRHVMDNPEVMNESTQNSLQEQEKEVVDDGEIADAIDKVDAKVLDDEESMVDENSSEFEHQGPKIEDEDEPETQQDSAA